MDGDNQYSAEGHGKQDATRSVRFAALPPVLHLQLKRFEFNMHTYSFDKVNTRFEFPEEFDMAPYLVTADVTGPPPTAAVEGSSGAAALPSSAVSNGSDATTTAAPVSVAAPTSEAGTAVAAAAADAAASLSTTVDGTVGAVAGSGAAVAAPATAIAAAPATAAADSVAAQASSGTAFANETAEETARSAARAAACPDTRYVLHSVLVHSGSVGGGHYYAFVRPRLGMACDYDVIRDGVSGGGDDATAADAVTHSAVVPPTCDGVSDAPTAAVSTPVAHAADGSSGPAASAAAAAAPAATTVRPVAYRNDSAAIQAALLRGEVG